MSDLRPEYKRLARQIQAADSARRKRGKNSVMVIVLKGNPDKPTIRILENKPSTDRNDPDNRTRIY